MKGLPNLVASFIANNNSQVSDNQSLLDNLHQLDNQSYCRSKTIRKGAFIYLPNDSCQYIYVLASGRVKIGAYSKEGREILQAILQKGEIFGELGLLGFEKRNEFAQAMEETKLYVFPLQQLKLFMNTNQTLMLKVSQLLSKKLVKAQKRVESQIFRNVKERIIEFIADLAEEKGIPKEEQLVVSNFYTHQEIAALTGSSRQTVTTILNELRDKNLIAFNRKQLKVMDLNGLTHLIKS